MDKDLFYISLFLIVIGVAGQLVWFFFAMHGGVGGQPTQASFQEIQNVTGYAMILGLIILPAGLFKDGLPIPGPGARIFLGIVLVVVVGLVFTTIIMLPGAGAQTAPKANGFISILQGSQVPGTQITFSPQNATIVIGKNNTVQWSNDDTTTHTVTSTSVPSGASTFNSGLLGAGGKYTVTFSVPGTYDYVCTLHGWMHGKLTVVQSSS
ncbi:MAG TPA: plastocyanin/azurin family copper-binding protein [Nitrososphaerales archaeon]|nr:plastocyanin/azurin family copper-binding protein [Nitrososphaerales archaeon]